MTADKLPLVFRPKKSSAIRMLLICGMFVAGGLWMAQEHGWKGYLCAGFFALGIPIAFVQLLPGSTYLRIADDGLSFANLFRVTTIPWSILDQFFVVSIKQTGMTAHKMVAFNYAPSYDRAQFGRRINSAIAQCEGALPDTYGQRPEELAEMLNRYLAQFKESHGEPHGDPEPPRTLL